MVRRFVTSFFLLISLCAPSFAGEMQPLRSARQSAAPTYEPARCAGLLQALQEWAGKKVMNQTTWDNMNTTRELFILYASIAFSKQAGGTFDEGMTVTLRDVRNIANLYLARFQENYALSGQAFQNDDLVNDDIDHCAELAENF